MKKNITLLLGLLPVVALIAFTFNRGITYHDEGYILNTAYRIYQGQVPYRDFHFAYTPGVAFITSLLFRISGVNILSERLGAVLIVLITLMGLWVLSKKISNNIGLRLMILYNYVIWGSIHINFAWPVMFALCAGVLTTLCLIRAAETKKTKYFLYAGITTTVTYFMKQNFGVAITVVACLSVIIMPSLRIWRSIGMYMSGLIISTGIYIGYLLATSSLYPFITDMWVYTVQRILIDHSLTTPFVYPASFPLMIGKSFLYLFPLAISVVTLVLYKGKGAPALCALFVLVFYVFGIRPTTDYIHLLPLLALSGLPLTALIEKMRQPLFRKTGIILCILFLGIGLYRGLFSGYYKWETPLARTNKYLPISTAPIYVDEKSYQQLMKLNAIVSRIPTEHIFVYEYAPLLYFLTRKQNPTKFDLIDSSRFYEPYQPEIIRDINNSHTTIVITGKSIMADKTDIAMYIKKSFHRVDQTQDYIVWQR